MRYSYEYKRKCVEMYREGRWPKTPTGIKNPKKFHDMIRRWFYAEEVNGPEILKHQERNKKWTPEEKYELVAKVIAGSSIEFVNSTLYWRFQYGSYVSWIFQLFQPALPVKCLLPS